MSLMTVPIIGIGAGPATDGQVLVFHDLLGIREGAGAKFVRRYADLQDAMDDGVAQYAKEVRGGVFPGPGARLRHRRGRTGQVPRCLGREHVLRSGSARGPPGDR